MPFPFLSGFRLVTATLGKMFAKDSSGTERTVYDSDGYLYQRDTKVTATGAELNIMSGVLATATEINRACDVSTRVVNATAATLAVTEAAHDNKVVTLNKADGIAVTLPAATGSGAKFTFVVGTTITSSSTTIKVTGNDVMTGNAIICNDSDASVSGFETASDSDTITFNGTTTGGVKGDKVELIDIAADLWFVNIIGSASSSEATPFSATVT